MASTAKVSTALVVAAVGGRLTIVFGTSGAASGHAGVTVTVVWLLVQTSRASASATCGSARAPTQTVQC
jgi:hypothetical protein